jgi:hypothetical protein
MSHDLCKSHALTRCTAHCHPSVLAGLAGLCAGISRPDLVRGVQLINISLRGLHVDRQPAWQRPLVASFQRLLK